MFGEYEEMMVYHSSLVYIMVGVLVLGILIPFLSSDCAKTIKRKRIYMFFSHGIINIVAFSGLVGFVFIQMNFNMSMAVMTLLYILLLAIESIKYLLMLKAQSESENCSKGLRVIALKYTLINIALVVGILVYKVVEHQSAVPTP